ncbi:MAG: hypothetical protein J5J00_11995 [Deltaproteobacteria bacterium]|nr:hypothetical protein [Deltaproteobacteria bacterium]
MAAVLSVFVDRNLDESARVTAAHVEREAAIVTKGFCKATSDPKAGCRISKVTEYILNEFVK